MIPSIGRIVIYHHPGSADGRYAALNSPAIIRQVRTLKNDIVECELFVFGPKGQHQDWCTEGDGPCQWSWPELIK